MKVIYGVLCVKNMLSSTLVWVFAFMHASYWQARAAITGETLVHFIGDSHTLQYRFGRGFVTHYIPFATAHRLWEEHSTSNSKRAYLKAIASINPKRDIIGLVFGEIDCRVHFFHQHKKTGKPIKELIANTVARYGKAIDEARRRNFRFFVVGVPPAGTQDKTFKHLFHGSIKERREIHQHFNACLMAYCKESRTPFFDTHYFAAAKDWSTRPEFRSDGIHLNDKMMPYVRQFLMAEFKTEGTEKAIMKPSWLESRIWESIEQDNARKPAKRKRQNMPYTRVANMNEVGK